MKSYKLLRWYVLVMSFLIIALIVILVVYIDQDLIQYILNRSVNNESNMVSDRIGLYSKWLDDITFLGKGLGFSSHFARVFNDNNMISDCDYIRILNEEGLVGISILTIIFATILIIGIGKLRHHFFEYSIVIFLLVAMIGAAPLEHLPLHPYMYWYCIGWVVTSSYKPMILSPKMKN